VTPHPDVADSGNATVAPYTIKLLTRATLQGTRWRVGAVISVPPDRLRVAAHLCRTGAARPADPATARDVELYALLLRALPPAP
jgi:hypothetical protein